MFTYYNVHVLCTLRIYKQTNTLRGKKKVRFKVFRSKYIQNIQLSFEIYTHTQYTHTVCKQIFILNQLIMINRFAAVITSMIWALRVDELKYILLPRWKVWKSHIKLFGRWNISMISGKVANCSAETRINPGKTSQMAVKIWN